MTLSTPLRRLAVTLGVALSLVAAGATIRAAASWTATEAPLDAVPVSVTSVQQALDQERARSAALEAQIADLESASEDLSAALTAARDQLTLDAETADGLRASLAEAQARLTKLEAALEAAAKARTGATAAKSTTTNTTGGYHEDDAREVDDD